MKLTFVVPRYGPHIVGGAETLCREYAERLARRANCQVTVLSTCAVNHFVWENELAPGETMEAGVRVVRYPVTFTKDIGLVGDLERRIADGYALSASDEHAWLVSTGYSDPMMDGIEAAAVTSDALLFMPYLFASTVYGARIAPDRSIIVPCLHDESYARFGAIGETLQEAAGLICNSGGEADLVEKLFPAMTRPMVVGAGFDIDPNDGEDGSAAAPSSPTISYAGRRERGKNWELLVEWTQLHNQILAPDDAVTLVTMGGGRVQLSPAAAQLVVDRGSVSEAERQQQFATSTAVAQLSLNESFSYVLPQAWLARTPVVVHANCPVTVGFCQESGGGLWVASAEEYSDALVRLSNDSDLRTRLGRAGRSHVEAHYSWDVVIDRLLAAIKALVS